MGRINTKKPRSVEGTGLRPHAIRPHSIRADDNEVFQNRRTCRADTYDRIDLGNLSGLGTSISEVKTDQSHSMRHQPSAQQLFNFAVRALQFFEQRQEQRLIHVSLGFGIDIQTVDAGLIEFRGYDLKFGKYCR